MSKIYYLQYVLFPTWQLYLLVIPTAECHLGKLLIDAKYQLDLATRPQCISKITIYKKVTDAY